MGWTTFWLDTNSVWGIISNREQWLKAKNIWVNAGTRIGEELKECPGMPPEEQKKHSMPKFGYVVECTGPQTLGDFFEEHGMEW